MVIYQKNAESRNMTAIYLLKKENMKKFLMICILIMLYSLCGCSKEADNGSASVDIADHRDSIREDSDMPDDCDIADGSGEETEVDASNRTMISEALHIDENSRSIRFILGCLNTIGAGQIQSVESIVDEGEKAIDLIAEDGTSYRIYLSGSGSVESVKNLDTNEWPIQSER